MPLQIGDPAPDFSGHDIVNDEPFSLSDHAGSVILLAFSGITWCPPCQYEAPYLQQLWNEFTSGITNPPVKFFLVSTQFGGTEPLGALQDAIESFGITFPVIYDHTIPPNTYDTSAVPTIYFIDTEGKVCGIHIGAGPPPEALMDAIREELYHCGANPPIPIYHGEWRAVAQILFGVTSDGGGLVIVGGKPVPVGPWDPLRRLGAPGRDLLRSLAAAELVSSIEDAQARDHIRSALLKSVAESAQRLATARETDHHTARTGARVLGASSRIEEVKRGR